MKIIIIVYRVYEYINTTPNLPVNHIIDNIPTGWYIIYDHMNLKKGACVVSSKWV